MTPTVHLTPSAEKNALARELKRRLVQNFEKPSLLETFGRMWGTIIIVCRGDEPLDGRLGLGNASSSTLTLRFDYGTLTIHEGRVGRPDLTLWGTADEILALSALRTLVPRVGLEVFGRAAHPRLAYRFGRLLDGSAPDA